MYKETKKKKKNQKQNQIISSSEINDTENKIFSNLSNEEYKNKKIFCIFQKNSVFEKSIGISYVEIDQLRIKSEKYINIFSGDFPLYLISSFPLYLSNFQPDFILLHCSLESKINEIFKNENLKEKIIQIPNINIQYKLIQSILLNYFQNNCNYNLIYSNCIVSEILSSLSFNSQCSLYTLFNLLLKYQNLNENIFQINFKRINFENILFVSNKTQKELNIFNEQIHPSLIKGFGKSKEGLSLYNLLNKCQTYQGKKLLKNILEFPLNNEELIEKRYNCINGFINLNNYSFIKGITNELNHIKDFDTLIKELKGFIVNSKTYINFFSSLSSSLKIIEIYKNKKNEINIIDDYFEQINQENLIKIYDFLFNCFDFSKEKNFEISIKNGINEYLDELKNQYIEIDKILQNYAIKYKEKIPQNSFIDKFMFMFIPQLGHMFAVAKNDNYYKYIKSQFINLIKEKSNDNNIHGESEIKSFSSKNNSNNNSNCDNSNYNCSNFKNEMIMTQIKEEENEDQSEKKILLNNSNNSNNIEEDEYDFEISNYDETLILKKISFHNLELNFQFHDEDMIYYKNEITNILDKNYGDLAGKITDCQNATFREISKQILEFENDIINLNIFISYLDVFIHFFILTEKYELYKPNIVNFYENDILNFENGRNLIFELTLNQIEYVKNNFFSNNKSLFIIFGSVNSGKSSFLKLIGTIIYLAQIGCFVPGKNFKYNIFNKILSNIQINESSIENMSGFTIESKEIKYILDIFYEEFNNNDYKSNLLILLDNPFKKTNQKNQNCLLCGIINYFNKFILEKKQNKKCKIFICINEESKNFLINNTNIDYSICDFYHMKNKFNEGKFINLFKIEKCDINDLKNENINYSRLFLAKNNGLDNSLFLRALEIQSILKKKEKLFPNIEKLIKVISNLDNKVNDLKNKFSNYCNSKNNLTDNSKEINLLEELNNLFI